MLINYINCKKICHEILEDLNALKIDITYKSDINFDAYKKILIQVTEDNGPPPNLSRLLNQQESLHARYLTWNSSNKLHIVKQADIPSIGKCQPS